MPRFPRTFAAWVAVLVGGCAPAPQPEPVATPALPPSQAAPEECPRCREQPSVTPEAFAEADSPLRTPWLEPKLRGAEGQTKVRVTDQDGKALDLSELNDRPLALTFLYTRCRNPNRCPAVADRTGELQKLIDGAGLDGKVSLAVVTYDPEFDTPERLKEYGREHGVRVTPNVRLLRPDPAQKDEFFDRLRVTVNYNAEGVNIHGLQLFLFDSKGRFVRRYQSVVWDNADVLADLKRLAQESR